VRQEAEEEQRRHRQELQDEQRRHREGNPEMSILSSPAIDAHGLYTEPSHLICSMNGVRQYRRLGIILVLHTRLEGSPRISLWSSA
jgi:hypothetical protein